MADQKLKKQKPGKMKTCKTDNDKKLKIRAIVVAAGLGKRFGSPDKVFVELAGKPVFVWSLEAFEKIEEVTGIWIVTRGEMIQKTSETVKRFYIKKLEKIIEGGKERQDSVYNALKQIPFDTDIVLIHDAARPMVSERLIKTLIETLKAHNCIAGVVPAVCLHDTIKWIKRKNYIGGTINRDILKAVQTPQVFWFDKIFSAYEKAYKENFYGTDDASLIEKYGGNVMFVEGQQENIKITTRQDLQKLETMIKMSDSTSAIFNCLRIGIGYDSHRFAEGKKLIIGGVEIPFEKGLEGHSDADVLIHAIIDALLGSAGLRDIGTHFPDTDETFKNISSIELLKKTLELVCAENIKPLWIDCIVFAEKPKISPFVPQIKENLEKLGLHVNIKAKTNEKMGFIGRQEGIAAQAVCLSILLRSADLAK